MLLHTVYHNALCLSLTTNFVLNVFVLRSLEKHIFISMRLTDDLINDVTLSNH